MTESRKKPKVTLTLDPEIRAAADELLAQLPGKVSLSALVDMLLGDFVTTVGPMIQQVVSAGPLERVTLMHQLAGQQMLNFGEEFSKTMNHLKELEARAEKEHAQREE